MASGVPAADEMLTMAPLPRASIPGSTACVALTTAAQLIATQLSTSDVLFSWTKAGKIDCPALLIKTPAAVMVNVVAVAFSLCDPH